MKTKYYWFNGVKPALKIEGLLQNKEQRKKDAFSMSESPIFLIMIIFQGFTTYLLKTTFPLERKGDVFRAIGNGLPHDVKEGCSRVKLGTDNHCAVFDAQSDQDQVIKVSTHYIGYLNIVITLENFHISSVSSHSVLFKICTSLRNLMQQYMIETY